VGLALCAYSISAPAQTVSPLGGSGITVAVTTGSACTWTAVSNASWLTITSGGIGIGSGGVTLSVAPNSGAERTGIVTVAGHTHIVTQSAAAASCSYAIEPTSTSVAAAGGGAQISVTAAATCAWTATSNADWITVTSGPGGIGAGTVACAVAANAGPSRSGTLTAAGLTFTVNQASGCTFSVDSTGQSIGPAGGSGTPVAVGTAAGCTWTAVSNASWITVTGGAAGSGNGTTTFSVAANPGAARSGTLTIATQPFDSETLTFRLTADTVTLQANVGIADRLDVGAALPIVRMTLSCQRIDTYRHSARSTRAPRVDHARLRPRRSTRSSQAALAA
jgi:hypothetical protein